MTHPITHISVSIDRPASDVYAFVSNPANLPQWASGLSASISQEGDIWTADSPMGKITIRFAPENAFGVMNHDVTVSGETFHNPMRVIPNGDGSELMFTLFHRPEMSADDIAKDAATIEKDLRMVKTILET